MPYIPSIKTDGKSQDRILIDRAVDYLANAIADYIDKDFQILTMYIDVFDDIARHLTGAPAYHRRGVFNTSVHALCTTIINEGNKYGYVGAFLGELNYAITRLIQRVPQKMVYLEKWEDKNELRYWLYAVTVEALCATADKFLHSRTGIAGVFIDVKDEYKRRVNVAYEAAQIIKSGDCYDTPYYTRLVEYKDSTGKVIGYQEIMLERSSGTLYKDVL